MQIFAFTISFCYQCKFPSCKYSSSFLYFFLSVQNRCCSGRCPPPFQLFQSLWLPHFARGPKVSASRRRGKAFYTLNAPQMTMLLPQMTTMMMMIMVNGDPHPHPLLFFLFIIWKN